MNQAKFDDGLHHVIEKRQSASSCARDLLGYRCGASQPLDYDYASGCFRCLGPT